MSSKSIPKIRELRSICQPSIKFEDTIILAYIVRYFSIYLTKLFLHKNISANHVSVISMLSGITGGFILLNMDPWYVFIGSMFLILHVILDFVDGEVARYWNNSTLTGTYLDDVNHSITVPLLLLFVSFGVFGIFHNTWVLFLGCLAAVCEPVGHNVHWGYPNRILYSELLDLIDNYSNKAKKDKVYPAIPSEEGMKDKLYYFFAWFHSKAFRVSIIKKLYDKIWFENRIVNIVILVGLAAPFTSILQYPNLHAKILSLIIIIYGINRPIVLLQSYIGRAISKKDRIENEYSEARTKLYELVSKEK